MKSSSIPLIFMGGWAGSCGERLAIPRGFLARQRSDDLEADLLAVQTMAKAGFDPRALVRYIERVQPPASATEGFAALPDREGRVAGMRSVIETLRNANYVTPTEDVAAVQQELRRLEAVKQSVRGADVFRRVVGELTDSC
jgi:predicted Zn-dependent protease